MSFREDVCLVYDGSSVYDNDVQPRKRHNLSRFKRTRQGIIEFATLIEQSDQKQRAQIMRAAEDDDPEFFYSVMRRVVFFEELIYIDEGILAELMSKVGAKVLAYALRGMDDDFRKAITHVVGHVAQRQIRDEDEIAEPSEEYILGARRQVLKIARNIEAKGTFVFEAPGCPRLNKKNVDHRGVG